MQMSQEQYYKDFKMFGVLQLSLLEALKGKDNCNNLPYTQLLVNYQNNDSKLKNHDKMYEYLTKIL